MTGSGLFWRAVAFAAWPPLFALPFWLIDEDVSGWAGSLALYEVIAVPILLGLAAFTFYRSERWLTPGTYLWALMRAALVVVGLWYLGYGLHHGTLLSPNALTVELMGIALSVQFVASLVAVLVLTGVHRMHR